MDIEFHAPQGKVKEWLIDHMRNELMELHHREKGISRGTVTFAEERADAGTAKTCAVDLYIFGDSIFVRRMADTYEQASREVLEELYSRVDERMLNKNEPPEELTSSVSI